MGISTPLPQVGAAGNILTSDGVKWASQAMPAVVNSLNGQSGAISNFGFGINQTWQNVMASRVSGTNYTNSTTKPILVIVGGQYAANDARSITPVVDGVTLNVCSGYGGASAGINGAGVSFIVQPNSTYKVTVSAMQYWVELR